MVNIYLKPVIQIPSALQITAITREINMVVTVQVENPTTQDDTYIVGMAVRLFVPITYGMYQADGLTGTIKDMNINDITLDIDSTQFDPFVLPPAGVIQPASLAPAGSRNYQYKNGSNISVPFQSLNNQGN